MNRRDFLQLGSSGLLLSIMDSRREKYIFSLPPRSSFTVYEHRDLGGRSKTISLDQKVVNQVYALKREELSKEISSVQWNLKDSKRLILYAEEQGQGHRYSVTNSGEDRNMERSQFNDCASSYRVVVNSSVPQHFDEVSSQPRQLSFDNLGFRKGTDRGWWNGEQEHFQGIQVVDEHHIMITTSDFKGAYFFIVHWEDDNFSGKSSVVTEVFIHDDFPDMDFNHCSGFQLLGKVAAIGLEYVDDKVPDNKPASTIVFYDLSDPQRPQKTGNPIVRRDKPAGTVGICFTRDNSILVVVGGKSAQELDFYFTTRNHQNSITNQTQFAQPIRWAWQSYPAWQYKAGHPLNGDTRGWVDGNWAKDYESINLIRDFDGSLFLVGFTHAGSVDWVDLYSITRQGANIILKKISKKELYCNEDVSLTYASGLYIQNRKINFIASGDGRTDDKMITLNLF